MKQFQEVAPPGWGHTKAEKEKTDPSKPKSKIGGSAAAFDRARKEGRFKGSKEDMFKLMWWMKNKGGKPKGKPHYKPGTDEKYKKYQEEEVVLEKDLNAAERRALPDSDFALPGKGEGPKGKQAGSYPIPDEKHARSALSLVAQHGTPAEKATVRAKVKKKFPNIEQSESFEIDKSAHKKVQKKAKLRNLAKGNMNPNEKAAAEKKAGGPKLYGEGAAWTKKSGKNPEGGLNEKGRKSYERDNPGSDLKAPQPEGGSRKKSFCARMGGMKKKLTSSKTANDPDSRINKALKKWKCNEESKGLYANIHAKRKRGERPAKPGEKGYPKPGAFASAEKTTKEELAFEGWQDKAREAMKRVAGKKPTKKHDYGRDAGKIAKELMRKKDHQSVNFLDPDD